MLMLPAHLGFSSISAKVRSPRFYPASVRPLLCSRRCSAFYSAPVPAPATVPTSTRFLYYSCLRHFTSATSTWENAEPFSRNSRKIYELLASNKKTDHHSRHPRNTNHSIPLRKPAFTVHTARQHEIFKSWERLGDHSYCCAKQIALRNREFKPGMQQENLCACSEGCTSRLCAIGN